MIAGQTVVTSGALTWWTLGAETDPDILGQALERIGLSDFTPNPRTYVQCLKKALSKVYDKDEELIRPLKSRQNDGYVVKQEERGTDDNDYDKVIKASVNISTGEVRLDRYSDNEGIIQHLVYTYRRLLPAEAVSKRLVEVAEHIGGVAIRPAGGLYFIPDRSLDKWRAMAAVVEAAGIENSISTNDFQLTEATMKDVRRAVNNRIQSRVAAMHKQLQDGGSSDQILERREQEATELRLWVAEYECMLKQDMDMCHDALKEAVHAYAVAHSIETANILEECNA